MPFTEQAMTSGGTASMQSMTSGGTAQEQAVAADDSENLYGAGPYGMGRYDVNLKMLEQSISAQ